MLCNNVRVVEFGSNSVINCCFICTISPYISVHSLNCILVWIGSQWSCCNAGMAWSRCSLQKHVLTGVYSSVVRLQIC